MKSIRLRFIPDDGRLYPMHEFVVDHGTFERTELHHWNPTVASRNIIVFEVSGTDVEVYETVLTETERVLSYELSQLPSDSFFIVVDRQFNTAGMRQAAAVTWGGLIAVPPVIFDGDRTVSMTFVGTGETLQSVVEQLPEGRGLEVMWAWKYARPGSVSAGLLSPRRREAVEATVDYGYYRKPRTGAVTDVAMRLSYSTSTAAGYLRKAEMGIMADSTNRS